MKTPKPFQLEAVAKALEIQGFLVADECGLGKTITGIEIAKALRNNQAGWRRWVVCPKPIRAQWFDVIQDQDPDTPVMVSNALPWDYLQLSGWVIATYPEMQGGHGYKFLSVLWDFIVVDEAHRLNNRKSVQFGAITGIPAVRRLALTGTPWENSPGEAWSILHYLNPQDFPSYWSFAKEWLVKEDNYFDHFKYGQPKDSADFADMLRPYMIRRRKDEVRADMPEKIIEEVRVEMTTIQANRYHELVSGRDIIVPVDDQELLIQNVLVAITRAQQLSTDPSILDIRAASGKIGWVGEFIADHPGEPILVFSRFRHPIEQLAERYKASYVVGGDRNTEAFVLGLTNLCFCTIDSIEGVDGLQRAKYAIFIDSHWSSIKMTQALDRIHRMDIIDDKVIYLLWSCREDRLVLDAYDKKLTEAELVYHFLQSE